MKDSLFQNRYIDPENIDKCFSLFNEQQTTSWTQVNCSLFMQDQFNEFAPWGKLQEVLKSWNDEGLINQFFFVRKPPGLRLRFNGKNLYTRFIPLLVDWLEENEKDNNIRGFKFSIYEPEVNRFGGKVGMEIAHDFFAADSANIIRYESAEDWVKLELSKTTLSLISMHHLFTLCTNDEAEVWDTWKQLELLIKQFDFPNFAKVTLDRDDFSLTSIDDFIVTLSDKAQAIIIETQNINVSIARTLIAAQKCSAMSIGPRAWLIALAVFHWNRIGLNGNDIKDIVSHVLDKYYISA